MRKLLPFLLLTACSSGAVSTPPPPPSGAPTAASLSIIAGDGQTAAPATALVVHPAVLVKDASGNPVPGVTVTFAVDSGGGSLSATSALSASDGVATAGVWTLGVSGSNVVVASVGNIAPVKFHAQALSAAARTIFSASPVGAGGGTLRYSKAGDALNGLTITVPAGAYPIATSWTVTADSSIAIPTQAGLSQVGPALVIGTGQGYASANITLTMPLHLAASDVAQAFYLDVASGTLEPVPVVDQTDTSATLATTHFSRDLMALPANGPATGSLRASSRSAFGGVVLVWEVASSASLAGTYTSSFAPGRDDWEWDNFGEFISPGGICEGMVVTAMYYRYFISNQGLPTLYHHFDKDLANPYDAVNSIRFAGSVQGDIDARVATGIDQIKQQTDAAAAHRVTITDLAASRVVLTLKVTRAPVLLGLTGVGFGHAVLAYSATVVGNQITVGIADPNQHGSGRIIVFVGGVLQPYTMSEVAGATPHVVTAIYVLGPTAEVPLTTLHSRWAEFLAKHSGVDRYPASYTFEVFDSLNNTWRPLGDTVRTTIALLRTRLRCPDCPSRTAGADPSDRQHTNVFNADGTVTLVNSTTDLPLDPGTTNYVVNGYTPNPAIDPAQFVFLDTRAITVKYFPFTIFPRGGGNQTNVPITFAAINGGLMTPGSTFAWTFGDGTPLRTIVGDSTVTHTFTKDSTFTISVEFRDASGVLLGRYSTSSSGTTEVGWKFTSAGVATASPPASGIGPLHADSIARDSVNAWLGRLHTTPTSNLIFVVDSGGCRAIALEQFPGATIDTGAVASRSILTLGINQGPCFNPTSYTGTATLGTLGSGTLVGTLTPVRTDIVQILGSVSGAMSGATLTGTLTVSITYTTGIGTYTVPFVARQILPIP